MVNNRMVSVAITKEAWDYAWSLKRQSGNTKSIGNIISDALLANIKDDKVVE